MFKKLLRMAGVSGVSVDTVLDNATYRPGDAVSGTVMVHAEQAADIEAIDIALVARVEAETSQGEQQGMLEVGTLRIASAVRIEDGQRSQFTFSVPLPWEAPITQIPGQMTSGLLGIRTEISIARASDKGDFDALHVEPLPSQQAVLAALGELGFHLRRTDLEVGRIHGVTQELPFYQELEFTPSSYAGRVNELEVTFVTDPSGMNVVLEADKRSHGFGGFGLGGSHDAFCNLRFSHNVSTHEVRSQIENWLHRLPETPIDLRKQHGHGGHHGGGHGGSMAGGLVAGVAGGLIMGEVFDEMGDFFGGEEEE